MSCFWLLLRDTCWQSIQFHDLFCLKRGKKSRTVTCVTEWNLIWLATRRQFSLFNCLFPSLVETKLFFLKRLENEKTKIYWNILNLQTENQFGRPNDCRPGSYRWVLFKWKKRQKETNYTRLKDSCIKSLYIHFM